MKTKLLAATVATAAFATPSTRRFLAGRPARVGPPAQSRTYSQYSHGCATRNQPIHG